MLLPKDEGPYKITKKGDNPYPQENTTENDRKAGEDTTEKIT